MKVGPSGNNPGWVYIMEMTNWKLLRLGVPDCSLYLLAAVLL